MRVGYSSSFTNHNSNVVYTLFALLFMVFGMVIIGGLTRLTGSGLSIVEWKPITGILPPLSHGDWMELFNLYKTSPEFVKINYGMTIEDFKSIFWLEYVHRLWGRVMGIILLVISYQIISKGLFKRIGMGLISLWGLGLGQGVLGWYMVKSGLINDPHVSPFRLVAHMGMAFLIVTNIIWIYLKISYPVDVIGYSRNAFQRVRNLGMVLAIMVFMTATIGGMVAGHKAGLIYNSFPLMDGNLMPSEAWFYSPWWSNLYNNPATIQWLHRVVATITTISVLIFAIKSLKWSLPNNMIFSAICLGLVVVIQYSLGIATILLQVPIALGVLHQATAFLLFSLLTYMSFDAARSYKTYD